MNEDRAGTYEEEKEMIGWIGRLLLNGLAVFLAAQLISSISITGYGTAILVAIVLGLINTFIRPILKLFALPITILTLGLFTFVINALLFWLTGALVSGFEVDGFVAALLGSIVVSVIAWILEGIWGRIAD
ncbi:phage holin family protein [Mechercharimyces sp. CAU 1602]|uniref:phage holin family protein n=1 Tax=Mechercharimyces sp. CAU 1602 TaxID=2973933 RepID=UPI002162CD90|nr:phage holin family protein [Mechercharimyces sp. CAU 1602]